MRLRELDGAIVFVAVNAALTLASAALCLPVLADGSASSTGMLRASVIYVAVVGWQPLVAIAVARKLASDGATYDLGIRPTRLRESMLAVSLAVCVLASALACEAMLAHAAGARAMPPTTAADLSGMAVARLLVVFVAVVALLWLQAIVEELAWRSYLLPRLMRTLGPWPGLVAHGILWGLCYAPWFALTGGSVEASLGFVVTCALLGVLLGWLRLRSRSLFASAASNATLTITAGLPLLLVGHDSPLSAVFEPPGWIPLAAAFAVIVSRRRLRAPVAVPWRRIPEHVN